MKVVAALLWLAPLGLLANSADAQYIGPEACAACHKDIAAAQSKTAMAMTWHGRDTPLLPTNYDARKTEGPAPSLSYEISRFSDGFAYSVATADGAKTNLPIEVIMGGKRHGLGFLTRIERLGDLRLQRPALIQARYFWSGAHDSLVLAPGTPIEKPRSQETSLGLVLDPAFEGKCLRCHFPDDLLIANQVTALQNSECFIQSGKAATACPRTSSRLQTMASANFTV